VSIDTLRRDIAAIDREILALAARRMKVAEQIGDLKREANLPIRNFRAEVDVIERAHRECEKLGLDPEVGTAISRQLIEAAVRTQHGLAVRPYQGTRKHVLVVGGAGRMGAWLAHFFASGGHTVTVLDPRGPGEGFHLGGSLQEEAPRAEVIVLATPIEQTAEILDQVVASGAKGLVFDICSLKSPIIGAVDRALRAGVRVASAHPLFAPGPVLLSGRILLVCDCGDAGAAAEARALFEDTALRIVDVSLDGHDRLMAWVLGASHAVNIAFGSMLRKSGFSVYDLDSAASTTYSRQSHTTREVAHENPRLYYEIQHANPHMRAVYDLLEEALAELREAAKSAASEEFERMMAANREWFDAPVP